MTTAKRHTSPRPDLHARWLRGDDILRQQEQVWGITPRAHWRLVVAPIVGAFALALTVTHRPLYRWLTAEDGPIEWLQFGVDAAGFVGAGVVSAILYQRGQRTAGGLWAVFALALLFIAGEEISWGQRIFGHATPPGLEELNHQAETNVHNIRPVQDSINVVFMLMGAYGSVGVLVLRRRVLDRPRPVWFDLFVPPVALVSLFGLVFAYKLARLTLFQSPRFVIVKYGEYFELCAAVALALFAWLSHRRLRRGNDEAELEPASSRPPHAHG